MHIISYYFLVFELPLAVVSYAKNHFRFFSLDNKTFHTYLKVSFFNVMQKERFLKKL